MFVKIVMFMACLYVDQCLGEGCDCNPVAFQYYANTDLVGPAIATYRNVAASNCDGNCASNPNCVGYVYSRGTCWLKGKAVEYPFKEHAICLTAIIPCRTGIGMTSTECRNGFRYYAKTDLRTSTNNVGKHLKVTRTQCDGFCKKLDTCIGYAYCNGDCWLKGASPSYEYPAHESCLAAMLPERESKAAPFDKLELCNE